MNLLTSPETGAYRRWVNAVASICLSGAGHYLSGRKRAAIVWFVTILGLSTLLDYLAFAPLCQSILPAAVTAAVLLLAWMSMLVDSCRNPMPRLPGKNWMIFVGLALLVNIIPFAAETDRPFYIPTSSMEPTILSGDRVNVKLSTYLHKAPRRGDIVVFKTSGIAHRQFMVPANEYYVKRIAGIPGDMVRICPPYVCINGQQLVDPPIFKTIASGVRGYGGYTGGTDPQQSTNEIVLGPDQYYVLGDNSANSLDSRYFGPVSKTSIIGKVTWIYWPPGRRGVPE